MKKPMQRSGKTISYKRVSKKERQALKDFDYSDLDAVQRPRTRGECRETERPCPFVACKYHLYLDVTPKGSCKATFADKEPWELYPCCALDVAEEGEHTLEEVGEILGVTRERIRQIESAAEEKLEKKEETQEIWKEVA